MVVASLPLELLFGVYLGILTGIIPALVAWSLGFLFRYVTGVTVPGFAVVVLGVAIAGINGGILALADPAVLSSGPRALVALVVVLMMTLYAHNRGDAMGAEFPHRFGLRRFKERALASDVVERLGHPGEVVPQVREVRDMAGYPPLTEGQREAVEGVEWGFPSDLPVGELESRFGRRLESRLGLQEVSVEIDADGGAVVTAAPPVAEVSARVGAGHRGVSVEGLVPAGTDAGDRVRVEEGGDRVVGLVVSVGWPGEGEVDGRVTVSAPRAEAKRLLEMERPRLAVEARGEGREFEAISLLRRSGKRFRRIRVGEGGPLDGRTLREAEVRNRYGVAVLAVKGEGGWMVGPRGNTRLSSRDEVFAVGDERALNSFAEEVS